ncbi:hypothetical protein E2P81_ATG07977 [Venturia nashicola]|uniref:Uncharacterized protein n=1 Tax=Venturia nashicola TaxID=86259 RepID=A0A4Z1NRH4_9PEZI|nr:hypothetical protein E6O75_ATG08150 [Venturia nashicola]TLD26165.1 hypothetical protein E2P81_ATG07977 [Venturia nashicola]
MALHWCGSILCRWEPKSGRGMARNVIQTKQTIIMLTPHLDSRWIRGAIAETFPSLLTMQEKRASDLEFSQRRGELI